MCPFTSPVASTLELNSIAMTEKAAPNNLFWPFPVVGSAISGTYACAGAWLCLIFVFSAGVEYLHRLGEHESRLHCDLELAIYFNALV